MKNYNALLDYLETCTSSIPAPKPLKTILLFLLSFISILISLEIILIALNIILGEPAFDSLGFVFTSFGFVLVVFVMCLLSSAYSLIKSKAMATEAYDVYFINPSNFNNNDEMRLYELVKRLSQKFHLSKMPALGIYSSQSINAFATGPSRNDAIIVFSSSLLTQMDESSIAAVAAHELAHIANGDMLNMNVICGAIKAVALLIQLPLTLFTLAMGMIENKQGGLPWITFILAGIQWLSYKFTMFAGNLLLNFFSRKREYFADQLSAQVLGTSHMINALEILKVNQANERTASISKKQKELAMFNISGVDSLLEIFSTHPTLDHRIERLNKAK